MSTIERIRRYLSAGGHFNPELMDHAIVRDLIIDAHDEIAEQQARLNHQDFHLGDLNRLIDALKTELIEARTILLEVRPEIVLVKYHYGFISGANDIVKRLIELQKRINGFLNKDQL